MADAGKIVITPKGAYSSTKTYEWLDEVSYNGNAYVALNTVTGVTPSDDGVNWRLFLEPNDIVAGNLVPTFTEASTRSNIVSGENLSTMFGKIKKWFTDLKSHAFKDLVNNLTTSTTGSALDASQGKILKDEVDGVNRNLDVLGKRKNIFNPTLDNKIINGITCTNNGDGTYTLKGTSTNITMFELGSLSLKANKTYRLVGSPKESSWETQSLRYKNDITIADVGYGVNNTSSKNENINLVIYIASSGITFNNVIFKPMVVDAEATPNATYDDFVPYTGNGKTLTHDVAAQNASLDQLKNDLGGLSFSVSGTTLSITDGTNTWTLSQ